MWTYGGSFPGPTIRRPAGAETRVTFRHELPAAAGELSVHLHGGHTPSADDGQPGPPPAGESLYCQVAADPGGDTGAGLLIAPGESRRYTYPLTEDGADPERAAFQWYHDHRCSLTARNVWRGLAGMFIIDDDVERALPLPRGGRDIPLMIADRTFDRHNQLTNPFGAGGHPPDDGVSGRRVLVNGAHRPHHAVDACRYRLRILNASHFRSYNLELSNGRPLTQIAGDSGLLPAPVERRRILVGPAERVEVVADFGHDAGRSVVLRSVRTERGKTLAGLAHQGPLMQFRVGARPADPPPPVPGSLRPLPDWAVSAPTAPEHTWRITVSKGFFPKWLINGKPFDPTRVDASLTRGQAHAWRVENATGVAHMFHIHSTDWLLLSRNGRRPPPWERCLKETYRVDPGDELVLAGYPTDFTGRFVVHCHMLDHEDHGLMAQFEVV